MPTIHLIIKGKVQGVFFRASAKDVADALELTGWVRNTEEGHVEITASGTETQLQKFTEWCKEGPPRAIVTDVVVENLADENFKDFRVVRR